MHFLSRAEPARNQECVHGGAIVEGVVRQHGEAGLRLHWTCRIRNEERVQLGIEPPCDREDAVRRGEIDNLGVFENVDAEPESVRFVVPSWCGVSHYASWPAVTSGKSISV